MNTFLLSEFIRLSKFELEQEGRVPLAHIPIAHIHSHRPCLEFFHWTTNQKILF